MNRKQKYRILLIFILLLWAVLAGYKGYLYLFEKDYSSMNAFNQARIQTLLDGRDSFSFAVVGNVRNSMKIFDRRIVPLLREGKVNFIISAGNAVHGGTEANYRILNRGLGRSSLPYLLGVGSREIENSGTGRFYRHFGPLFFTMEAGEAYFIFLDSTGVTNWEWQVQWLEEKLKQATGANSRFVILNHSLLELSDHPECGPEGILDAGKGRQLHDLFGSYGVTAVFSSSCAVYDRQRSLGVEYITSGCAGGLLLDEKGEHYQYLKVDVSRDRIDFSNVEVPNGAGLLIHKMENLGYFLHSLFYISFTNFLMVLSLIGLAALRVYSQLVRQENLFRDFDLDENMITSEPVRVAIFTDNYLPYIGGVPISIQRLSQGLLEKGSAVKIFAPSYGNYCPEEDDGIVYRCRTFFLGKKMQFPITNIFSKKLEEELNAFKPDLVHVHHPFWLGNKGRKLARKSGVPVVFTYHTRLDRYMHNIPLPGTALKETFAHCLIKRFANRCDAIIAPSFSTEEYLRRLGVLPMIATIPTGINMQEYSQFSPDEIRDFRCRYAADGETLLISVCRLAREKNVDFMIDGLVKVRERTSVPFRCIVVGDGPERPHLERKVTETAMADSIFFTGAIKPNQMVRAYLASDLFVFASTTETQGMVMLEAMAGGCPVVAVNASGVYDVVEDGLNGFKVHENIESWAESIILLLENGKLIDTLSGNSKEFAEVYSGDRIAERVLRLYRRTLLVRSNTGSEREKDILKESLQKESVTT
jgi:1,2-diacylglycerol 3-alpha-glucosyltransferase